MKSHSAVSGYTYQYCFEGYRELPDDGIASDGDVKKQPDFSRHYDFTLSPGREQQRGLSIVLSQALLDEIGRETGRTVSNRECYAVAKLSLFNLLDETHTPALLPTEHSVGLESALEIWSLLDL